MYDEMIHRAARYQRPPPWPLLYWIALGLFWFAAGSIIAILLLAVTRGAAQSCGAC